MDGSPPLSSSDAEDGAAPATISRAQRLRDAASRRVGGVWIVLENITNYGNRAAILCSVESLGLLNVIEVGGTVVADDSPLVDGVDPTMLSATAHDGDSAAPPSAAAAAPVDDPMGQKKQKGKGGSGPPPPRRAGDQRHIVNGAEKWLRIRRFASVDALHRWNCSADGPNIALLAAVPVPRGTTSPPCAATGCRYLGTLSQCPPEALAPRARTGDPATAPRRPVGLVFGNELRGVTHDIVARCEASFSIDTPGLTESLNVSVAVAVIAYAAREKRLEALRLLSAAASATPLVTDLSPAAIEELYAEYCTLGRRFAKKTRAARRDG